MPRRNHALERVGRVGESPIQATSVGDARFLERNSPRSSARVFPIRAHSSPGCTPPAPWATRDGVRRLPPFRYASGSS